VTTGAVVDGSGGGAAPAAFGRGRMTAVLIVCATAIKGRVGDVYSAVFSGADRAVAGRSTRARTFWMRSRRGNGLRRKASAPAASTARMRVSERTAESAMRR